MKNISPFNQNISSILKNNILIIFIISLIIWLLFSFIQIIFPKNEIVILFSSFIKKLYSNVCHQADNKLIIINGEKTFLCARCIGIYLGSLISLLLLFFLPKIKININMKIILFSFMILTIDVILHTLHFYDYSKVLAFFTGIFFSFVLIRFTINSIKQN